MQCWILCTYSALQISFFEVICSSVFLPWINMTKSGTLSLSFTLLFLKSITLFLNGSCRMFFHSAISTNITWPNEHLSNVNTRETFKYYGLKNLPSKRLWFLIIVFLSICAICRLHYCKSQVFNNKKREINSCVYSASNHTKQELVLTNCVFILIMSRQYKIEPGCA